MTTSADRTLPHNLDAERSILGAVLVDNDALLAAQDVIGPQSFFRDAHRRIYEAMLTLDRRRTAIDLVMLREELDKSGTLEEVGGPAYISQLVDGVPRTTNVKYYAQVVREKATLRQVIFTANRLLADAYEADQDPGDIIARAEHQLLELSRSHSGDGFVHADALIDETYKNIERFAQERAFITGLATGLDRFDIMTRGLQPGDLVFVAGRPSMGKTALALQWLRHTAHAGCGAMFSIEMSRQQLGIRLVSQEAGINSYALQTGRLTGQEYEKLAPAMSRLATSQFAIDDSGLVTISMIRSRAVRLAAQHPLVLLIIDYIQLIDTTDVRSENRQQALAAVSKGLKQLAKELRVPVVALSQLSRASEARTDKRPQLSDLRESGSMEQDADVVALIHRPEVYEGDKPQNPGLAELIIAKQRNGPIGTIKLKYVAQQTRFDAWQESES